MIVTDKLLFLHLHKSGGTFVNALLLNCLPSARQIGYHLPYRAAPPTCRHLPVVGTVRSPWAYYVSWYHFQSSQAEPNILFRICSNERQLGFKETVANLLKLEGDHSRLDSLKDGLPEHYQDYGLNLTKACVEDLRSSGLGFYSFLYKRLYAGAPDPLILRMEQLREELRPALETLGHLPNQCIDRFLNEVPPLNTSRHEAPRLYFNEPLAALVAERDREVVDAYGYTLD